jgi:hypothetical protein
MKPTHGTCDTWAAEGRACSGWSTKCAEVAALQALLAQPAAQAMPSDVERDEAERKRAILEECVYDLQERCNNMRAERDALLRQPARAAPLTDEQAHDWRLALAVARSAPRTGCAVVQSGTILAVHEAMLAAAPEVKK